MTLGAAEVDRPPARQKVACVTGATGTIGFQTVRALLAKGLRVVLLARDPAEVRKAVKTLQREFPLAECDAEECDLSSQASIRHCAAAITQRYAQIDILINNAGVMAVPQYQTTEDGQELQFATNYLGHFALTGLLLPLLLRGGASRVIAVSSEAAYYGRISPDDIQSCHPYHPWVSYCNAKLACLMFALELNSRFNKQGITGYATSPGIVRSNLQRYITSPVMKAMTRMSISLLGNSAENGAVPTVFAALNPEIAPERFISPDGLLRLGGRGIHLARIPRRASDQTMRRVLWEASEKLTGVTFCTNSDAEVYSESRP